MLCENYELPLPEREYRFHPPRRWRFDFAWVDQKIAVEVEGGLYVAGRHQRPGGYLSDIEKYNQAVMDGWRLLRWHPKLPSEPFWSVLRGWVLTPSP